MAKQDTHPVYIKRDRKTALKTTAAEEDESMKTVTMRYIEHGEKFDFHTIGLDEDPTQHVLSQIADGDIEVVDNGLFIPINNNKLSELTETLC